MASKTKKQLSLFSEDVSKEAPCLSNKKNLSNSVKQNPITFQLITLPNDADSVLKVVDLKTIREHLNLSLDDVFIKTKIPIKHIHALESGNRTFLPPIHVRAFLRTLAELYEVDWTKLNPPEAIVPPLPQIKSLDEIGYDERKLTFWETLLLSLLNINRKISQIFSKKVEK